MRILLLLLLLSGCDEEIKEDSFGEKCEPKNMVCVDILCSAVSCPPKEDTAKKKIGEK